MPSSVQQTFVGRENGTDTKNSCKEAISPYNVLTICSFSKTVTTKIDVIRTHIASSFDSYFEHICIETNFETVHTK